MHPARPEAARGCGNRGCRPQLAGRQAGAYGRPLTTPVEIYLARHGETDWSRSGRHTSRTDLPLTSEGEREAEGLRMRLNRIQFAAVYSSPLQRARRTAEIAGFGSPRLTPLLREFDYGDYEGLTTAAIHQARPAWELFRDGCPNGESPEQAYRRAQEFIRLALTAGDRVIAFAHGHILRMVAVAFLDLPAGVGARLGLDVATISILVDGERGRLLERWNAF